MTEPAPGDTAPPAIVTNLEASGATASSITLSWAAPGDDGSIDTASEYDIRYSGSEITQATWDSATQCTGKPAPQAAGSSENFIVTGLYPDTTYYFALKTADEVPNWSGLSNVLNGTTSLRTIPLTKTVKAVHEAPIEPSYASMGISCDLIGVDENGEDIYVISEVYCLSQYFLGYYEVSIGSSSGIIWENRSVTIPPLLNPHGSPLDFGTLYLPSRELKEGIRVYPSDWISVQACGVTERELFSIIKVILYGQVGGAPLFYESAESYLAADYIDTSEFPPIVVGDMEEPPQAFGHLCSPLSPSDSYSYEVRGLDTATYDLGLISVKADESVAFLATNIPTAPGTVHQYTIAWDALSEDKNGVTVQVDSEVMVYLRGLLPRTMNLLETSSYYKRLRL